MRYWCIEKGRGVGPKELGEAVIKGLESQTNSRGRRGFGVDLTAYDRA